MDTITGYVDHIIFRNSENGYTVLVLVVDEEEITAVGIFSDIAEGEYIEATGEYTDHPTYGRQFKVEYFEKLLPTSKEAIIRFLSSSLFAWSSLFWVADKTASNLPNSVLTASRTFHASALRF